MSAAFGVCSIQSRIRRLAALLIIAVTPFSGSATAAPLPSAERAHLETSGKIGADVVAAFDTQERVRVMVAFAVPNLQARATTPGDRATRRQAIRGMRDRLLHKLRAGEFEVAHQYGAVNALAGTITVSGIARLADDPGVLRIDVDTGGSAQLREAVPLTHLDVLHQLGFTGRGVTAAIIDSGADTDHPDLADSIVAQHCVCETCANVGCTRTEGCCPDGSEEQDGAGSAEDDNGHGTNVTGILTSNGSIAPIGGAPDAQIVAVKVLDSNAAFITSGQVVAGLDWIINERPDVRIVNMSLGTNARYPSLCVDATGACQNTACTTDAECLAIGATGRCNMAASVCQFTCTESVDCTCGVQPQCSGDCDRTAPDDARVMAFAQAINTLRANGVVVFASSGNQRSGSSMPLPACIGNSISVGAVWDSNVGTQTVLGCTDGTTQADQITCFSNSNASTDVLAAGAPITSTGMNGGTSTFRGTSQSSPMAAACGAALLEAHPGLAPDQLETTLETSPIHLTDEKNGLSFPRVDCEAALASLGTLPPTLSPTPSPTISPTGGSSPTPSPTPMTSLTPTRTGTTPTPTSSTLLCTGDCDNSHLVSVDELVLGVNIALDRQPITLCEPLDQDHNKRATINELVTSVNNSLSDCRAVVLTGRASLEGGALRRRSAYGTR